MTCGRNSQCTHDTILYNCQRRSNVATHISLTLPFSFPFDDLRLPLYTRRHSSIGIFIIFLVYHPSTLLLDHLAAATVHHVTL